MTRARWTVVCAAALVAVACVEERQQPAGHVNDERLSRLDRAFATRSSDPESAARLFADAGPGSTLERARLEGWLVALASSSADVSAWREVASSPMPDDLETRALLGLARALAADGHTEEAVALLQDAPDHGRRTADQELLQIGDGPWRLEAASRMAVSAPNKLRRDAPELEDSAVASLAPEQLLERSAAWRGVGGAGRGATELRRHRWRGELESSRRLELARCEIASGNPGRAIDTLRGLESADGEVGVVRADAYRRRGWQRYPRANASPSFSSCMDSAVRAADAGGGDRELRIAALRLIVECGTEAGRLAEALQSWWLLEGLGWQDDRRGWLGRRLGVGVARRTGDWEAVLRLASSLPDHERCLGFWAALGAPDRDQRLAVLASVGVPDLYSRWAREILGQAPPATLRLSDEVEPAPPPDSVAWLMDRDALNEAAAQWRRIRSQRRTWPGEGLAVAEFAEFRGRRIDAIRALRTAMPELGTVTMDRAPANGVRAYLPLEWEAAIREAAEVSDVDPWLLAGLARQESAFVAHARSPRGAMGVMQLLPSTARGHARTLGYGSRPDLNDPAVNIRIGARELSRLLRRFGAVEPALAAYNAGETRVRRWWQQTPDRYRFTEMVPIPETYSYIRRVTYLAEAYRLVYAEEWSDSP